MKNDRRVIETLSRIEREVKTYTISLVYSLSPNKNSEFYFAPPNKNCIY